MLNYFFPATTTDLKNRGPLYDECGSLTSQRSFVVFWHTCSTLLHVTGVYSPLGGFTDTWQSKDGKKYSNEFTCMYGNATNMINALSGQK